MKLNDIIITVNYFHNENEPGESVEATVDQLCEMIKRLAKSEPDMTSFVITAAVDK